MTSAINWNLEGIIMAENNVKSKEKTIHDGVSPHMHQLNYSSIRIHFLV